MKSDLQFCGTLSLLSTDSIRFSMLGRMQAAGGEILEEIEESKAFWEVYDGAVYMFQVGCRLMDAVTAKRLHSLLRIHLRHHLPLKAMRPYA